MTSRSYLDRKRDEVIKRIGELKKYSAEQLASPEKYKQFSDEVRKIKFDIGHGLYSKDRKIAKQELEGVCSEINKNLADYKSGKLEKTIETQAQPAAQTAQGQADPLQDLKNQVNSLKEDYQLRKLKNAELYQKFWVQANTLIKKIMDYDSSGEALALKNELRNYCSDVAQKEMADEKNNSESNKKTIENLVNDAKQELDADKTCLKKARGSLYEALHKMQKDYLLRKDKDECWQAWHNVKEQLEELTDYYLKTRYEKAIEILHEARDNPYVIKEKIRELQQEMSCQGIGKEKGRKIYETLREAWDIANTQIGKNSKKSKDLVSILTEINVKRKDKIEQVKKELRRAQSPIERKRKEAFLKELQRQYDETETKINTLKV